MALELQFDIIFVSSQEMLISISKPTGYVMTTHIESKNAEYLRKDLDKKRSELIQYAVEVECAKLDGDKGMEANTEYIRHKKITMNTKPTQEAVLAAEIYIMFIKERMRAFTITFAFRLPLTLGQFLSRLFVDRINMTCGTKSPSNVASPIEGVTGRKVDENKYVSLDFVDYVQPHKENTDRSMNQRTPGSIALHATGNL